LNRVGFVLLYEDGCARLRLYASPPSLARRHISTWTGELGGRALTVVVMGELRYRDEVLAQLHAQQTRDLLADRGMTDAALVAVFYDSFGDDGLGRLEGDFALAIHDAGSASLLAYRDPSGSYPLFIGQTKRSTAVSTSIRALADHLDLGPPDTDFEADFLSCPLDSLSELPVERTPWRGATRVLPGVLVTAADQHRRSRSLWDWPSRIEPMTGVRLPEAGDLLRERLLAAVRERVVATSTAAHFSGGMDSTGIAILADEILGSTGGPLSALTLSFAETRGLETEAAYVAAALAQRPALRHVTIPMDSYLEFDGHAAAHSPPDEPSAKQIDALPSSLLVSAAADAKATTILTGSGGDQMFFRSRQSVAALLARRGELRAAVGTSGSRSVAPVAQAAIYSALPLGLRRSLGAAVNLGRGEDPMLQHLDVPPWITKSYARRHDVSARTRALTAPRFRTRVFGVGDMPYMAGDWYHWNVAVPRGITQTRPYLDPRVAMVALGISPALHVGTTEMKPVLASALNEYLPATILRRDRKSTVNPLRAGFNRHRAWLLDLAQSAPAGIDANTLRECIEQAALGIHHRFSLWRLRMTLSYLWWLRERSGWSSLETAYLPEVRLAAGRERR
jgi:asparagine synthase (glutamine-hydrolysing)